MDDILFVNNFALQRLSKSAFFYSTNQNDFVGWFMGFSVYLDDDGFKMQRCKTYGTGICDGCENKYRFSCLTHELSDELIELIDWIAGVC